MNRISLMNDGPQPDWMEESTLEFWEPDKLYVEWLTFLYTIWRRVDYL